MGGHTLQGAPEYAHEYLFQEESVESSTFWELLGVIKCLKSMVLSCEGKFAIFQVDAHNLLGIINRGSPRLKLNELAREPFFIRRGAQCRVVGGVGAEGAKYPSRRAIEARHSR
jgi:hypothetical protein